MGDFARTLEFVREQTLRHGATGKMGPNLGYGPDGRFTESRSILTAVNMNTLRCLLQRDASESVVQEVMRFATADGLEANARMDVFLTLLDVEAGESAVRRALDTSRDPSVQSAIAQALTVPGRPKPKAAISLVEQYEQGTSGETRATLGRAIAQQLPLASALEFLVDHATADFRAGRDQSDAFTGIVVLGNRPGAFPLLKSAYEHESLPMLRNAFVQGAIRSQTDQVGPFLLDVGRHDAAGFVRGQAWSRLPAHMPGEVTLAALKDALVNDRDDDARSGALLGLVNLVASDGRHAEAALREAAAALCQYGHGNAWASMVPHLVNAADSRSLRNELVVVFSRERSAIRDPAVSDAVAAILVNGTQPIDSKPR